MNQDNQNQGNKFSRQYDVRTMVRSLYDLQKLRIQMGNRIVAQYKSKLGQVPGKKETDTLSAEDMKMLTRLRVSYKRITDGIVKVPSPKSFVGDELITSYTEFCLIQQYIAVEQAEEQQKVHLKYLVHQEPLWQEFLEDVKGCGETMTGVLLSEFDIHKATYVSSLWKYSGLDVKPDGRAASNRKEHLIDREYKAKDGTVKVKKSITYNPWLKSKLLGVLGPSFLMQKNKKTGEDGLYRSVYLAYRARLQQHPVWKDRSAKHQHNAAVRYMVKIFLIHLYEKWRSLEGLPVNQTYQEAKLGHYHDKAANE
jgi:hypothetical protein